MPERVLGSTALTFVLVTGLALLVARATWPPRLSIIAMTAFALSFVYQVLLLFLLGVTSGVSWAGISVADLVLTAALNVIIAVPACLVVRALDLRFGEPERVAW
jgi:hypothetical protein